MTDQTQRQRERCRGDYLAGVLTPLVLRDAVAGTARAIREHAPGARAIAYTGNSGALVAPAVALRLRRWPVLVRKSLADSHACSRVEGLNDDGVNYVIVDDFVDSGHTVREIFDQLSAEREGWECVGIFLYADRGFATSLDGVPIYEGRSWSA